MRHIPLVVGLLIGCTGKDTSDTGATVITSTTTGATPTTSTGSTTSSPEAPWPEWAFHHWVWEDESTQDSVLEMVDGYADRDIPVGAVIIDSPWETGYNTLEWDPALFPDPQALIDELHDRDIKVFLWIVPGINVDEKELWAEAADAGYFMQRDADSGPAVVEWWKGEGSLIDYFNPDAVDWWHGLLDPVLALGIDGWKCDGLDFSAIQADYSPALGVEVERIEYSHAYYQDTFDYTRLVLGDERLITARPIDNYGADIGGDAVAFAPIEINWAGWVGDQDGDFGGLRMALRNMYHSSEYGYVAFGSDIGGYREADGEELGRTKEVFLRWAQVGAFNPVMENGGGGNHWPWLWDDETAEIYQTFVNLHYTILPYLMETGGARFAEGRSMMEFTDDETYPYLLGDDLFVAPFLETGTSIEVEFPAEGEWRHLFGDSATYGAGETHILTVQLEEAAVFVRVGSELEGTLIAR